MLNTFIIFKAENFYEQFMNIQRHHNSVLVLNVNIKKESANVTDSF
jgi:hypothetical protein